MDITHFFALLKKHRLTLIIIPLLTIVVTFFLVRNLPDVYTSNAELATGLVDQSQQLLDNQTSSEMQVQQQFSNLITTMQLNKIFDQVSYQLMLHDLTGNNAFRKPSKNVLNLNPAARQHAIDVYTRLYQNHQELSLWNQDQKGLQSVIESMHYDAASIQSKLKIYRYESSDFIWVEFDSENPQLSAFVVNTLCKEFITYYTSIVKGNQLRAVTFLSNLLKQKKDTLDAKTARLKNYKIQNHILNLNEQAKSLYAQIADFETRKEQAEKDVEAYTKTLANIDHKFDPADRRYFESSLTKLNTKIISTRAQLKQLTDAYITSNYDSKYKDRIDSVQTVLSSQINDASDKYAYSPLSSKTKLVEQKLNLELSLDLAKYSIKVLSDEINRLNSKYNKLVPHEAVIQSYENQIDVASKEYLELLQKYNQSSMQSNFDIQLHQVDAAMPGTAAPSKKMLLVILSGIISFIFCLVAMFILFYLDESIKEPGVLANKTNMPVLGHLSLIDDGTLDLKKMWDADNRGKMRHFKDLLRSIRYEIDQELKGKKVVAITSLEEGEGKTLLAISLAYSYATINKKVLLIDGNFENPQISKTVQPKIYAEDFFSGAAAAEYMPVNNSSVIGNKGTDITLLEINDDTQVAQKFDHLRSKFDIIIIEVPALTAMTKAKEWLLFADKTIGVFEMNQSLTSGRNNNLQYLKSLGPRFSGWVFNKAQTDKRNG
jgi:succinoglycan biosynthesis transport protein ExoP